MRPPEPGTAFYVPAVCMSGSPLADLLRRAEALNARFDRFMDAERAARRAVALPDRGLCPTCEGELAGRVREGEVERGLPCRHPLVAGGRP